MQSKLMFLMMTRKRWLVKIETCWARKEIMRKVMLASLLQLERVPRKMREITRIADVVGQREVVG